ncbi:hypothetical protein [Stigmatella aurantiaca]|nr:hypothetical protein [Stigmatella aurantiaca]
MNPASAVIDLEEFRKRRSVSPAAPRTTPPAAVWSPVWVWVMFWPT